VGCWGSEEGDGVGAGVSIVVAGSVWTREGERRGKMNSSGWEGGGMVKGVDEIVQHF
jgi:hypothetical protein